MDCSDADMFSFPFTVSSLAEIRARKAAKHAQKQAKLTAEKEVTGGSIQPEGDDVVVPVQPPEAQAVVLQVSSSPERPEGSNKRSRSSDEVIKTYQPQWGVLTTDQILVPSPQAVREVAPDLCRGMALPADRSGFEEASAAEALTELMSHLALVSFST